MRWCRTTVVMFTVISSIIFCLLAAFMKNKEMLILMRGLQITSSFAVAIRFWPAAKVAWREDFRTAGQVYAFAMMLLSIALGGNAIWLWLWRSADEPRWVVDSWVNGYFVLLTYLAQSGKLIAPGSKCGKPQHEAYAFIGWTIVLGAIIGVIGLLDYDYATHILSAIEPFTRENAIWDPAAKIQKWLD
jgi:hypothetical protein